MVMGVKPIPDGYHTVTPYLIVKGELPDREHYERWENNIKIHTMVHENIKKFMEGYRYDAHPMGMLLGTVGALSTFYPDANDIHDLESRRLQTRRLLAPLAGDAFVTGADSLPVETLRQTIETRLVAIEGRQEI